MCYLCVAIPSWKLYSPSQTKLGPVPEEGRGGERAVLTPPDQCQCPTLAHAIRYTQCHPQQGPALPHAIRYTQCHPQQGPALPHAIRYTQCHPQQGPALPHAIRYTQCHPQQGPALPLHIPNSHSQMAGGGGLDSPLALLPLRLLGKNNRHPFLESPPPGREILAQLSPFSKITVGWTRKY